MEFRVTRADDELEKMHGPGDPSEDRSISRATPPIRHARVNRRATAIDEMDRTG